jgi:hypothetical protein
MYAVADHEAVSKTVSKRTKVSKRARARKKRRETERHRGRRERAAADGGEQAPMGQHRSSEKDAKSAQEFNSSLS